jgi:hypothetical protein
MPSGCAHPDWHAPTAASPLVCALCGVLWPGTELPEPAHKYAGYGELRDNVAWSKRVARMTKSLSEVE